MEHNHCLNCGQTLQGKYCADCGQAASTHKFSLTHIFTHDLMHGLFHVDRGFFYTVKEILIRPGKAIRAYVDGRRVIHYNYFALIILLIAANHLLTVSTGFDILKFNPPTPAQGVAEKIKTWTEEYQRLIILCQIPLYALSSFVIFRKAGYNYAEHLVINAYMQGGVLLLNLLFTALAVLVNYLTANVNAVRVVLFLFPVATIIYPARFYWQFFSADYKNKFLLAYRSASVLIFPAIVTGVVAYLILTQLGMIS